MPKLNIEYTSNEKKRIAKANADFAKMTKPQRAVAVAKDVLAQIKAGNYTCEVGGYVNLETPPIEDLPDNCKVSAAIFNPSDLQCQVCARGAMFMSAIRKFNKFDFVKDSSQDDGVRNLLHPDSPKFRKIEDTIFSREQIGLIESAFECCNMAGSTPFEKTKSAIFFGILYNNDSDRMQAIMRNIIKNDGKFVP